MKPMIAITTAVLGLAGCAAPRSSDTAALPGASNAALVGSTLVDCGEGRRALVQQANGAASIQCVAALPAAGLADAGYVAAPPSLQQPFASAPAPVYRDVIVPRQTSVAAAPVSYGTRPFAGERRVVRRGRTWKKSAAIIGGSTAAGAGVGALLGGGGGAKKGAVVGLVGGTIYDLATRNGGR